MSYRPTVLQQHTTEIESVFEDIAKNNGPHCHFLGNHEIESRPRWHFCFDGFDKRIQDWTKGIYINPGLQVSFGNNYDEDRPQSPFSLSITMKHDRGTPTSHPHFLSIIEEQRKVHDALIQLGFIFDTDFSKMDEFYGRIIAWDRYEQELPRRTASIEKALQTIQSVFNIRQNCQNAIDALLTDEK